MDLNNRMNYEACSPTEKAAKKHDGLESIQWMKDKIGRINSWAVCYSKFNPDDKSVTFECMTGNRQTSGTSMTHLSYEEICRLFWWKSFEVVGPDTIKPVKMTLEERNAIEKPVLSNVESTATVIDVNEDALIAETDADMFVSVDEDVQDE